MHYTALGIHQISLVKLQVKLITPSEENSRTQEKKKKTKPQAEYIMFSQTRNEEGIANNQKK